MEIGETLNMEYIDEQYRRWKADPDSVARDWQFFFKGFETAEGAGVRVGEAGEEAPISVRVSNLIDGFRRLGHMAACLDPLEECPEPPPFLSLSAYGLTRDDLSRPVSAPGFFPAGPAVLGDLFQALQETYCGSVGVEFMHLMDPEERQWLQDRMEPNRNQGAPDRDLRAYILKKLIQAERFEAFLNRKFMAQTRFSLEGAEGLVPMLDGLFHKASMEGVEEIILGMAHRGRLNVQTNVIRKPYSDVFLEFKQSYDPGCLTGSGDVKYHKGYLADLEMPEGRSLRVWLASNPSHLEAVDPVIEGIAYARQHRMGPEGPSRVLPVQIHGDAAFAGQGIVAETLNLSQLEGYATGGTVHIVVNNQIGYTTLPEHARSSQNSTDVAKMLSVPVFHVQGENPEALLQAIGLALDYRNAFGKDVVLEMICYRRYGHNEGDEPYFTQPLMYERIRNRKPLPELYGNALVDQGVVTADEIEAMDRETNLCLEEAFEAAGRDSKECGLAVFFEEWGDFHGRYDPGPIETGGGQERLKDLSRRLNQLPEGFSVFDKLAKLFQRRLEAVEQGSGLDWANAETLAFATLITEGHPVRLSGQDSGRGTFSQRHAVVVDTRTGEDYVPLNHLEPGQAPFEVFNSMLSESAVMGFEYGVSLARPEGLVLWEAQFGDFANNAQSVIDLFIAAGEAKWGVLSGLTLLLPHGWEGLGPEHSSARLERFLQLSAGDNIIVAYPTTPAQYFHLLRRQALARWRKPLIVMTPKSLLRNPVAVSDLDDLTRGSFQEVLGDPELSDGDAPKRVVLTSGKLFYELLKRRQDLNIREPALVRIEQLHPFPVDRLEEVLRPFLGAEEWIWAQEEPANMGAWIYVRPRIEPLIEHRLDYVGRNPSSSPATGFAQIYRQEQGAIADRAVGILAK